VLEYHPWEQEIYYVSLDIGTQCLSEIQIDTGYELILENGDSPLFLALLGLIGESEDFDGLLKLGAGGMIYLLPGLIRRVI
jgi:hypothetical protein